MSFGGQVLIANGEERELVNEILIDQVQNMESDAIKVHQIISNQPSPI